LGPPQQRAVLAALLVDAGQPVTAEQLVDRVWGEAPPAGARRALHAHISRIRRMLCGAAGAEAGAIRLVWHHSGYLLDANPELVDWHRFGRLVAASKRQSMVTERVRLLRDGLALWRGAALADVPGQWAARTRDRWRQQRLDALIWWAEAELLIGGHDAVIGATRELLDEHPLVEPLVVVLLQALVAAGRPAEALAYYAAARARLADELGTDPGPRLQQLHRAILRGDLQPGTRNTSWRQPPAARTLPGTSRGARARSSSISACWRSAGGSA
jgi:DNA-binding SARP family transcriptional activator